MPNFLHRLPFSPLKLAAGIVGVLLLTYIGLIAIVVSYAALTVEFTQSVKQDEAHVATLEAEYLAGVARITEIDYTAAGYTKPVAQIFVAAKGVTALR
jgi:hypothetical protein